MAAGALRIDSAKVILALAFVAVIVLFGVADPIPQDPAYHRFADQRTLLGVPNFVNVVSNAGLLLVGLWGLGLAWRIRDLNYAVLFIGLTLTAFGSVWYHLVPDNATLFWDRLPMTVAFAGLAAAIVAEYYSARAAVPFLIGFLLLGIGSVLYWAATEARGAGDLRPYAVVAILPLLLVPLILVTRGARSPMTRWFWAMLALYVPAKLFEYYDAEAYVGEIVSGHSLKHVFAALSTAMVVLGIAGSKR